MSLKKRDKSPNVGKNAQKEKSLLNTQRRLSRLDNFVKRERLYSTKSKNRNFGSSSKLSSNKSDNLRKSPMPRECNIEDLHYEPPEDEKDSYQIDEQHEESSTFGREIEASNTTIEPEDSQF